MSNNILLLELVYYHRSNCKSVSYTISLPAQQVCLTLFPYFNWNRDNRELSHGKNVTFA